MQAHQPDTTPAATFIPGFTRRSKQVVFIQAGPDVLLGRELEIIKFQLDPLTGNEQIRLDAGEPPLKLRIEAINDCLAFGPLMNILRQRPLHANGFALPVIADLALINTLAALPEHSPKFTKTFKQ